MATMVEQDAYMYLKLTEMPEHGSLGLVLNSLWFNSDFCIHVALDNNMAA